MKPLHPLTLFILLIATGIGCTKDSREEHAQDQSQRDQEQSQQAAQPQHTISGPGRSVQPKSVQDAMQQMGQILSSSQTAKPVDARELKGLLPDNLPGIKRTDASAQKTNILGVSVTMAKSTHKSQNGDGSLDISITDLGRVKDAAMFGQAWLRTELDRQSDSGYEQTTMYKGFPAYQKFKQRSGKLQSEMTVVVANRFIIDLKGHGLKMNEVNSAIDNIDINKLNGMKWD